MDLKKDKKGRPNSTNNPYRINNSETSQLNLTNSGRQLKSLEIIQEDDEQTEISNNRNSHLGGAFSSITGDVRDSKDREQTIRLTGLGGVSKSYEKTSQSVAAMKKSVINNSEDDEEIKVERGNQHAADGGRMSDYRSSNLEYN